MGSDLFSLFKPVLAGLEESKKKKKPRPDNAVFRLHYQMTFLMLGGATLMITSYNFIDSKGSAIQCMTDKNAAPTKIINNYCWIMSTFTLPKHYTESEDDPVPLHLGVGPAHPDDEKVYHQYYQWVPLFFMTQAIMFYLPHWVWKQLEGDRLYKIMDGLQDPECENIDQKIENLSKYMKKRQRDKYEHKMWAAKLYFCEVLNFVNVIFQILLTDRFLGYAFSEYGTEVFSWAMSEEEGYVNPMRRVFPFISKCKFQKFGPGGTIQLFDALCVLGMNIVNQGVFLFFWLWFIILAVITGLNLVYRVATWFVPAARGRIVKLANLGIHPNDSQTYRFTKYLTELSHADWLIFYYLADCMYTDVDIQKNNFCKLIDKLSDFGETNVGYKDESD